MRERQKPSNQDVDDALVQAAPHFASHDELAILVRTEIECAETIARSLPARESDDHELVVALALDLDPIACAARAGDVGSVGPLGNHALQPLPLAKLQKGATIVGDVIEDADGALALDELGKERLSRQERQGTEVERLERQQIENDVDDRRVGPRKVQLARLGRLHSPLQSLKARTPLVIESHDFAVEHDPLRGEGAHRSHDFGKGGIGRAELAKKKGGILVALLGNDTKAIELQLVDPPASLYGRFRRRAQHGRKTPPVDHPRLGAEFFCPQGELLHDGRTLGKLFHREAREDAARLVVDDGAFLGKSVGLLEKQPFALPFTDARAFAMRIETFSFLAPAPLRSGQNQTEPTQRVRGPKRSWAPLRNYLLE